MTRGRRRLSRGRSEAPCPRAHALSTAPAEGPGCHVPWPRRPPAPCAFSLDGGRGAARAAGSCGRAGRGLGVGDEGAGGQGRVHGRGGCPGRTVPGGGRGRPSPASPALQLASCLSPLDHAPNSGDNAFTEDSGQWGASALLTPAACSRPPCRLRPPRPARSLSPLPRPWTPSADSLCGRRHSGLAP